MKVPKGSKMFQEVPEGFKKVLKVPRRSQEGSEGHNTSKGFLREPLKDLEEDPRAGNEQMT